MRGDRGLQGHGTGAALENCLPTGLLGLRRQIGHGAKDKRSRAIPPFNIFLPLVLGVIGLCGAALGDPLPAIDASTRKDWRAVGIVNAEGLDGLASCTGTLIAPDLVLTAAHCAWGDGPRYFIIGGLKYGTAHRSSSSTIHPEYTKASDIMRRYGVDLALITLETAVADVRPVPVGLFDPSQRFDAPFVLLGYHRMRPALLNGRFDCLATVASTQTQLQLGCEVISGNSGGPVLAREGNRLAVIGVAVATLGKAPDKQALVALLDDWVLSAH